MTNPLHVNLNEHPFESMVWLNIVNLSIYLLGASVDVLFGAGDIARNLVPYFQLLALGITIFIGWRNIRNDKKARKKHGKEKTE